MSASYQVLICDDDPIFHLKVKESLKKDFECKSAFNGDEAMILLKKQSFHILLLDIRMRTLTEGFDFIPKLLEIDNDLSIVIVSALIDFEAVRIAMRLGAVDYIAKDFELDSFVHVLLQIIERRRLLKRQRQQDFETKSHHRQNILIGESSPTRSLRKMIEKISKSSSNVVIFGETGTGKELVARQLRTMLPDGTLSPFLAVDSATIQNSMAESILFGHEKGAFTGADKTTKGIFEEADGGTVYFDEISNMPPEIQSKLLRVLQEKEITRIGSSRVLKLKFRVICATNKDLEVMASAGNFKYDLLQRLNVIPIHVPPLRERKEDIPLLVDYFIQKHPSPLGHFKLEDDASDALQSYSWPGNIRELENLIAYLATMIDDTSVKLADLPLKFRNTLEQSRLQAAIEAKQDPFFYEKVSEFERNLLSKEYELQSGNISRLALKLGMDRSHLYTKLKEFGIHSATPISGKNPGRPQGKKA